MKSLILKLDSLSNKMSKTIFSPLGKVVLGFLSVGLIFLFAAPSGTYSAVQTLNLKLEGAGATPWSITNIVPGNEGIKSITVRNTGPEAGQVTIWLSNVVSTEGENPSSETGILSEPGELDKYLRLKLSAPGLESNFSMPAYIKDFPQTEISDKHVRIARLEAGASIDLTWKWDLPVQTGNEVQGDTIKFDVNYTIENFEPEIPIIPGVPPEAVSIVPPDMTQQSPVRSLQIELPGAKLIEWTNGDGKTTNAEATTAKSTQVRFSISLQPETKIVNPNRPEEPPHILEVIEVKEKLPLLPGWTLASPIFDVSGFTYGVKHSLVLDKPAILSIGYDPALLPQYYEDIAIFYFNEVAGVWVRLEEPPGYVAETGTLAVLVNHFSIFTVLVKPCPGYTVGPASFEMYDVSVGQSQITVGEEIDIKIGVSNTGGKTGEYPVTLSVNGVVAETQTVTLAPLQRREVYFKLTPESAGKYRIEVGGETFDIDVINPPPSPMQPVEVIQKLVKAVSPYAWLIFLALGVVALLAVLLRTGKTQS